MRRALVVGIDDYPRLPARSRLEGAAHDAEAIAGALEIEQDFAADEIELLVDRQATRDGILAAMARLLARSGRGDVVYFHFSGHGSRRRADDRPHRGDGWEHSLVPQDSGRLGGGPNRDISGPELLSWLQRLAHKRVRITVVLDCCHAGNLSRSGGRKELLRVRSVVPDDRPPQPRSVPWTRRIDPPDGAGAPNWLPLTTAFTVVAACRHDELAHEVRPEGEGTRAYGALSHAWLRALAGASEESPTYRDLYPALVWGVQSQTERQHPQIEGAVDRILWQHQERGRAEQAVVQARAGRQCVLDMGEIHGVAPGGVWSLHAPTPVSAPGTPLAEARVSLCSGISADAELEWERTPARVGPGCRAIQVEPGPGSYQLPVLVEASSLDPIWGPRLKRGIEETPELAVAVEPDAATVHAVVLEPRMASPEARAVSLGALSAAECVLLDGDDRPVAPRLPLADPATLANTLANLRALSRARRLLELRSPPEALHGLSVDWQLLRRDLEGAWRVESSGAQPILDDGESFALRVVNRSPVAIYPWVFSIGVGGGIVLLHPAPGVCEPLLAERELMLGQRFGDELSFRVPATVPFDQPGASGWIGLEHLVLIATRDPTDLSGLSQASCRGVDWRGETLSSVSPEREARRGRSPASSGWVASRLRVRLRRKRPSGRRGADESGVLEAGPCSVLKP